MVFASKKSTALLVLVSGASLFSADPNVASVDSESNEIIKTLQTRCENLNGLFGKWIIESDKSAAAEGVRKEISERLAQLQWNFTYSELYEPILALIDLHHDKRSAHIAHVLGVYPHVDSMLKLLHNEQNYKQHLQTIKNYITAAALMAKLDNESVASTWDAGNGVGIYNPIDLLRSAAKQASNDAVKLILYEKLDAEQVEKTRAYERIFSAANTMRVNLTEENKLKDQKLQGEQANVETVQEINIKLAHHNSYLKSKNLQLAQEKSEIEKECAVAVVNKEAIIDVLRKKGVELESENTMLREELARLMQSKKSSWFGGLLGGGN